MSTMTKRILRTLCVTILGFGIVAPVFAAFPTDPVQNSERVFGPAPTNDVKFGIQYNPASTAAFCYVDALLRRQASPTDYVRLEIRNNPSPNFDSGTPVAAIDVLGSTIPTTAGGTWIRFQFANCLSFSGGGHYTFVFSRTGSLDATNYYYHYENTALNPTPDKYRIFATGSWSADLTSRTPALRGATYPPGAPGTTLAIPTDGSTYSILSPPNFWAATSDISCTTYPDLTGAISLTVKQGGVTLGVLSVPIDDNMCTGGNYSVATGSSLYPSLAGILWVAGSYELTAVTQFDGFEAGPPSNTVDLTITASTPGGGGGSGGDGTVPDDIVDLFGGGPADITAWATAYPSHDSLYGSCDFWTDAMGCLWSWVEYAYIPDSGSFTNILAGPFGLLITRWPFAYVLVPLHSFLAGVDSGTNVCPIPDQFGYTVLGLTTPTFSICDIMDTYSPASQIAANAYMAFVFLTCVWLSFAMLWWRMAQRFLHG